MKSKRNGHAPFWRKSKNAWYVHHQGRMLSLGRDKDMAWAKWHELQTQPAAVAEPGKCLTIADLADAYRLYAELYYRKDGRPTSEAWIVGDALRRFCAICGTLPIHQLSPVHVERFQEVLVDDGLPPRPNLQFVRHNRSRGIADSEHVPSARRIAAPKLD